MCCCAITTSTFSGIKKYAISIQGINRLSVLIRRCAQWQKEREEKLAKPPATSLDITKEQEPPEPERD